jgi:hypothetical protein
MLLSTGFLFALVVSFSSCKLGAGWGSGNADDQPHRHLLGAKDISKQVRDSVRKPWLVEEVPGGGDEHSEPDDASSSWPPLLRTTVTSLATPSSSDGSAGRRPATIVEIFERDRPACSAIGRS